MLSLPSNTQTPAALHTGALHAFKALCLIGLFLFAGCLSDNTPAPAGWIDTDRLLNADDEPENWMSLGRNFEQQQYAPTNQINAANVGSLGLAWESRAIQTRGRVHRGLEATPIVVDGVMYTTGAWSIVYALDAKTGEELWHYDPEVDGAFDRIACCDVVNRGVQVWQGKVYVGSFDGYLIALDAATGAELWKVDTFTDRDRDYSITSAPQIAGDKIIIGNGGADFGVRGYITAYNLETGEQAWRFFIVPGDPDNGYEHPEMAMAAETWDPNSDWESGGGGTAWGQLAYDPTLNLLYVGTGNSAPYPIWLRSPNGGDNLFLSSILAINPDTGRMVWHYQTTPGEIWDYTATQNIILADLEIDGAMRKVLMQAPKNGFFYVLDRETGELLGADKYVHATWASHIDMETGRPMGTEAGDYRDEPKMIYPWDIGGHSWQPMSFSPQSGLAYIPVIEAGMVYTTNDDYKYKRGVWNVGIFFTADTLHTEMLKAWDPVKNEEAWRVPLAGVGNGGILSTGGNLVFQGTATGQFVVYNAKTGEALKSIDVGTGIMAAPITYTIDGEQYVAVMAGFGGALIDYFVEENAAYKYENFGRVLAFKLDGDDVPLPPKRVIPDVPEPPARTLTDASIAKGSALYYTYCVFCHGGTSGGRYSLYPDLTRMPAATHNIFNQIVLDGALKDLGMASFADVLSEADAAAIQDFLVSEQARKWQDM